MTASCPVSASTTPRGRLVFGIGIGVLTYIIRTWGGYPDGVAFSILLMNLAAPTIDLPQAYLLQAAMPSGINSMVVAHAYGLDMEITAEALTWSTGIVILASLGSLLL